MATKTGGKPKAKLSAPAKALLWLLIIGEAALIYALYTYGFTSVINRAALALVSLFCVGVVVQRAASLNGGYGLYLVGSEKGLQTIDNIARKHPDFWLRMADWGFVLGFGLLSYPFIRGRIGIRTYAFGMLSLVAMMLFIIPNLGIPFQFINIPKISAVLGGAPVSLGWGASTPLQYAIDAVTFVFGLTGLMFGELLFSSGIILNGIGTFLVTSVAGHPQTSSLTSQIPGIAPILPGIDIPFAAGIISLAFLLIIHEASHGFLSRLAEVKLKSIGLLLFGMIPVGAFVEPDEKQVNKLDGVRQTQIFSAGISANLIAMVVFFVLTVLMFLYVLPGIYTAKFTIAQVAPGMPANGILAAGMQLVSWNGHQIRNLSGFEALGAQDRPNSTVVVGTTNGTFSLKAVADPTNSSHGVIGVGIGQTAQVIGFGGNAWYFVYSVVALSFILNFLVAVVNLLPVPGFDGWRIYRSNMKPGSLVVKALQAIVILTIVINALPWLF
ncbi:MAG: site-2 protease family protein [Candidatus Micrarchaeota archaeon]|nr:site-2 protease family protein [Candidatus Micrarchaeota archaeon]